MYTFFYVTQLVCNWLVQASSSIRVDGGWMVDLMVSLSVGLLLVGKTVGQSVSSVLNSKSEYSKNEYEQHIWYSFHIHF